MLTCGGSDPREGGRGGLTPEWGGGSPKLRGVGKAISGGGGGADRGLSEVWRNERGWGWDPARGGEGGGGARLQTGRPTDAGQTGAGGGGGRGKGRGVEVAGPSWSLQHATRPSVGLEHMQSVVQALGVRFYAVVHRALQRGGQRGHHRRGQGGLEG